MAENRLSLGGRTWTIAPLSWRKCKEVEPLLFAFFRAAANAGADVILMDRAVLNGLADAAFIAISAAEPTVTRDQFDDLPFASRDLLMITPVIARAVGMEPVAARGAAEPLGELATGTS
jgi:hypothetical protein